MPRLWISAHLEQTTAAERTTRIISNLLKFCQK